MQNLTSSNIANVMRNVTSNDEGVAVFDPSGKWIGVLLTPAKYQLLKAVEDLATHPAKYEKSLAENMEFQLGQTQSNELHSFEQVFGREI